MKKNFCRFLLAATSMPAAAACLILSILTAEASAVDLNPEWATRFISGSDNSRDDNNGGLDNSLIGINPGGVDNFTALWFNLAPLAGLTVSGDATLTVGTIAATLGGNHGTADDTIVLSEIYASNAGWVEGSGTIRGADQQTDTGWPSFLNRVQYNDDPGPPSGTTEPWMDASGAGVANLLEAIVPTPIDTEPGYAPSTNPDLSFVIPQAQVQDWIDNGFGGLLLSADDNGDVKSRFNVGGLTTLSISIVPEPASAALVLFAALGGCLIRRSR